MTVQAQSGSGNQQVTSRLEGTCGGLQSDPCSKQDHPHQVVQGCVQLRLGYLKELYDLPPLPVLDLPPHKIKRSFPYHLLRISHFPLPLVVLLGEVPDSIFSAPSCLGLADSSETCPLPSPPQAGQTQLPPHLPTHRALRPPNISAHQDPQVPSCDVALRPVTPHLVLASGLIPPQGQDVAFAFTRSMSFLQPAPVSLNSTPVLPSTSFSSQFGVICQRSVPSSRWLIRAILILRGGTAHRLPVGLCTPKTAFEPGSLASFPAGLLI